MGLRRGKRAEPAEAFDRLGQYPKAAEKRYQEAEVLARNGHYAGAIYLLGYTAEMYVKYVAYRLIGLAGRDIIEREDRKSIERRAEAFKTGPSGGHDVLGWSRLIEKITPSRPRSGRPERLRELVSKGQTVANLWDTDMRYHATDYNREQHERMIQAVNWIREHHEELLGP